MPPNVNTLPSVNWHVTEICNFQCNYCYATFSKMPASSPITNEDGLRLLSLLADAGVDKITFVGGEPTLHPHLVSWTKQSRSLGMVTAMITNGTRLVSRGGHDVLSYLDWCGLSLDSASPETQNAMGRRLSNPVEHAAKFGRIVRQANVTAKLNTVVTRQNVHECVSPIVEAVAPSRWKIFQYLPMEEERVNRSLMISSEEFREFVARHKSVCQPGVMEWEDNDRMIGSYAMIDPRGRFFDARKSGDGKIRRKYANPILSHGVIETLSALNYDFSSLVNRGGLYDWRKEHTQNEQSRA